MCWCVVGVVLIGCARCVGVLRWRVVVLLCCVVVLLLACCGCLSVCCCCVDG